LKVVNSNTGIVFSNTIRGISSSLLNAFICFAFTALNLQLDLKDFVIFFTGSNLLLIVFNWGLKDYSVKLFTSETETKNIFSKLFSLRVALYSVFGVVLAFLPLKLTLLTFILAFSFFKSVNNTIEAFSTSRNKNAGFAFIDILSLCILVIAYILNFNFTAVSVFILITGSEILKAIVGLLLFNKEISLRLINPFPFLKETVNYFLVAFFAFLLSKVDFYISSFYLNSKDLINYHIYSSLIGLSQIIITSFFSRQMVNWFKSKDDKFNVDMKRFSLVSFALSLLALPFFYFITLYFYKFNISVAMLILVFLNLFIFSFTLLEIYLNTHQNKHRVILTGVLFCAMINIVLSFIIISHFEVLGAILANIISLFTLYLYFKIVAKYRFKNAS
jgi:O-antigen/teichoic acid export membrane protein